MPPAAGRGGQIMKRLVLGMTALALVVSFVGGAYAAQPGAYPFTWSTVVNNSDYMPTALCKPATPTSPRCRKFNSYNQPSVNAAGLVVFRARSRGGEASGEPIHGVYTRDMSAMGPIVRLFDRDTPVPPPNNRGSLFTEPPSFPRIDVGSDTVAVRGNHQPVWQVLIDSGEVVEQVGTSGIYTDPFGELITGASKLGGVDGFSFFQVPELPGTQFDMFPGAPSVTDGNMIVFKGNYTNGIKAETGVYYREIIDAPIVLANRDMLSPAGGDLPVVLVANSVDTRIPGTNTVFGSLAPPSAAHGMAVFTGLDNEDKPTLGGIYLARLDGSLPALKTLVWIGERVPREGMATFNRLGEGLSFDGRFVAFWGAWGAEETTLILQCPTEGNKDRQAYCAAQYPYGFAAHVPVHQGIFVYDTRTGQLRTIATAPSDFSDFLYWNYSGHIPGSGDGDGEPARWRASAFVAVSGAAGADMQSANFRVAFKARTAVAAAAPGPCPMDGIYLAKGPGNAPLLTLVNTGMAGTLIDAEAFDPETAEALPVTALGIERDGFRGNDLVVTVSMGDEQTGWAGIYLTQMNQRKR